ncbi:Hypothetical_protein [Hexamita inflata]|uniref:Hypothetical_protein n=1 Tax=Hexamita inflata TaxID=28002 RepID=A0ABP1H9R5_9EUKA
MKSIITSPAPSKQIVKYNTLFIHQKDVKRQKIVAQLDKAEKRGDIYFGTDYYCNMPIKEYDMNETKQLTKSRSYQKQRVYLKPALTPRVSASLLFQQSKNQKCSSSQPKQNIQKKTNISYSEQLFLKELNQLDICYSDSSDSTNDLKTLVVNRSGETIEVQQNTYNKSDKVQHALDMFQYEIQDLQNQLNRQIASDQK